MMRSLAYYREKHNTWTKNYNDCRGVAQIIFTAVEIFRGCDRFDVKCHFDNFNHHFTSGAWLDLGSEIAAHTKVGLILIEEFSLSLFSTNFLKEIEDKYKCFMGGLATMGVELDTDICEAPKKSSNVTQSPFH